MYCLKMNKCWLLSGAQYGLALVRVMSEDELKRDCFSPAFILSNFGINSLKSNQLNFETFAISMSKIKKT